MVQPITAENAKLYVFFEASGLTLAVSYNGIREVIPYTKPVPVPGAPSYIAGIINFGGQVCPVVSINRIAGTEKTIISGRRRIIMLESPENSSVLLGLLADYFLGSARIKASEIKPLNSSAGVLNPGCLEGEVRSREGTAFIFLPFVFFKELEYLNLK